MGDDCVLDASVAGAVFFSEQASDAARAFVREAATLIAPDLLFIELASLASKKVRRGDADPDDARYALNTIGALISEVAPSRPLAARACELAMQHDFSAYDGLYLALAEENRTFVITADAKLVRRAEDAGLSALVRLLDGQSSSGS